MAAAISEIEVSPDITINLGPLSVADEDVAVNDLSLANLGALPAAAELVAYHRLPNGDRLVAFDTTLVLPGNTLLRPGDVGRFNGSGYSLEFDGRANGVPPGVRIDAISTDGAGQLLLSFDITLSVDGLVFDDEDIARFDGADFTLFFDASAAGIDRSLDLDAAHYDPLSDTILLSFDSSGQASGVTFADEDLLAFQVAGASWSLAYDGSANHGSWAAADLDAGYVVLGGEIIFIDGFE